MSSQAQCPNCGGYKVEEAYITGNERVGCYTVTALHIILAIFSWGIWLIGWFLLYLIESTVQAFQERKQPPFQPYFSYACQLCGYKWAWREGTPRPKVKVNQELVALGAKKLKADEEEAERRRQEEAALHYLSQQGKK